MKRRGQISKSMVAAITFGMAMLLLSGIMVSQCGSSNRPVVVIMDTVTVKSDTLAGKPKLRKAQKKKPAKRKVQPVPESRDYRDEIVN